MQARALVLDAAVRMLRDLKDDGPERALAKVQAAGLALGEVPATLIWHTDAVDSTRHYALLFPDVDGGTVTVSRGESGLPWPMRGAHRWSEADVVRVNGRVMQVEEAVAFLEIDSHASVSARSLVDACLVQEELDRAPVSIPRAALQKEMDRFRRARGLRTRELTEAWLRVRGMTHGSLERLLHDRLAVAALRRRIGSNRAVSSYFIRHRSDYDTAWLELAWYADEDAARDARAELERGRCTLPELGRKELLRRDATAPVPTFLVLRRHEMEPEIAGVFDTTAGSIVGPLGLQGGFVVSCLLTITSATLTPSVRDHIERRLFEDWLEQRRQSADIEWLWGRE